MQTSRFGRRVQGGPLLFQSRVGVLKKTPLNQFENSTDDLGNEETQKNSPAVDSGFLWSDDAVERWKKLEFFSNARSDELIQ